MSRPPFGLKFATDTVERLSFRVDWIDISTTPLAVYGCSIFVHLRTSVLALVPSIKRTLRMPWSQHTLVDLCDAHNTR